MAAFDSINFVDHSEVSNTNSSDTDSGTEATTHTIGKIEHANTGKDTDTESGSDTVTDTYVRAGNIGVTMTQQLLTAEESFWSKYSFFEHWFNDIAEQIGLPIWG